MGYLCLGGSVLHGADVLPELFYFVVDVGEVVAEMPTQLEYILFDVEFIIAHDIFPFFIYHFAVP